MTCSKSGYQSQRIAEDHMKKRQWDNPTLDLRVYRCPDCGLWHMTHKPDREVA